MGLEALVFQNSRGQDLVGVLHQAAGEGPHPCIIVCHGFAGTKTGGSRRFVEFGRFAASNGYSVFRFDFAGSGDSDGNLVDLTLDNELDDLDGAISSISEIPNIDTEKIIVVGHCMGAVTTIRKAARDNRIYKAIAWAPFTDLDETMSRLIGEEAFCILQDGEEADFLYNNELFQCGPNILLQSKDINMTSELSNIKCPLLVIHGTEDATVPLEEVEKLMETAKNSIGEKRLEILEGAHHSFPYHKEELFTLTVNWLNNKL